MKIFTLILLLFHVLIYAREPYHVRVTVDSFSELITAPNLVDLKRDLSKFLGFNDPNAAVDLDVNLRGILANASFAANSTTLVVEIPQADITASFTGGTREESIALFKESIQDGGPRHRLLRAYSRYSPIDPIAGNPNSLQARMADADYDLATLYPLRGCDCCFALQPNRHYFQLGLEFVRGFSKGFETSSGTLPLRYSYSPCNTYALIIDAPLTYNKNGGASSLLGSVGVGFQFPLNPRWTITSIARLGSGGSVDLCTGSALASFGINSHYILPVSHYLFGITNYASYNLSTNLWVSGINLNYHLHNFIFKNGISLTSCKGFSLCKRTVNYRVFYVNTCFTYDSLYINHYNEIGGDLIMRCINPCLRYDSLAVGYAYQFGEKDYKGHSFRVIYQF